MKRYGILAILALMFFVLSCSKEHEALPTGFAYDPLPTPTDLVVTGESEQAVLTWDYPAESIDDVMEFRVYYYLEVYGTDQLIAMTTETSFTDESLIGNLEYCYRVSAVDSTGFEGRRTGVACGFIPSH